MSESLFDDLTSRRSHSRHSYEQNSRGQDEWLTPPNVIAAVGPFDLDPAAPIRRPWPTASRHYTVEDDGLRQDWGGMVWLNPPYTEPGKWLAKLARHGNGIALLFARTETQMWHEHIWPHASLLLFLKGRLRFHLSSGQEGRSGSGSPSVLIAYGEPAADRLRRCSLAGHLAAPLRRAAKGGEAAA